MRKLFFTLLSVGLLQVQAQTDFAKSYGPLLSRGFDLTIEVAETMPENLYLYTPEKGAKSFAEQIIHSSYICDALIDIYVHGNTGRKFAEPDATKMSKAEVIAAVKGYKEAAMKHLNEITDAQLAESVKLFGQVDTNKQECFYFVRDHMTNHRAKANLYMRIAGLNPPSYGYF